MEDYPARIVHGVAGKAGMTDQEKIHIMRNTLENLSNFGFPEGETVAMVASFVQREARRALDKTDPANTGSVACFWCGRAKFDPEHGCGMVDCPY